MIFREEQKMRHSRVGQVILVLLGLGSLVTLAVATQAKESGELIIGVSTALLLLLPLWLIWAVALITEVREDGLYIRFVPFHRHFRGFAWDHIAKYSVRTYSPLLEYGGWGIRGLPRNRAYNISGNQGLQLELKDGKRLLIGTQQPQELFNAVEQGFMASTKPH